MCPHDHTAGWRCCTGTALAVVGNGVEVVGGAITDRRRDSSSLLWYRHVKDLAARPYHLHCLRSCAKRVGAARQQLLLLLVRLKAIWLDSCRLLLRLLLLRVLLLLLLLKSQLVCKLLLRLLRLRLVRLLLRVVVVH
jgi:hypothetical protein